MDSEYKEYLRLTWSLVLRQHQLIGLMIPTTHDVERCMTEGRTPTPEQVSAWSEANRQVTLTMNELTSAYKGLQKSIEPLIGYDA